MGKYKVLGYFTGPNVNIGLFFDSPTSEIISYEIFAFVGLGSLECFGGISAILLVDGIHHTNQQWGKCLGCLRRGLRIYTSG